MLRASFAATAVLAALLGPFHEDMVPLTICALTLAAAFGLGTGAVFKLVAQDLPDRVGAMTGLVGAAGGLGGFFPPLVMAAVNSITGSYLLGFLLLALTALACLVALETRRRAGRLRPDGGGMSPPRARPLSAAAGARRAAA